MTDDQKALLDVLKKFDKFCKDYNIEYYLGGGNALGAIRHRGFIPWDDDLDMYITRDNANKLFNIRDKLLEIGICYIDHKTFPKYGNTIIRLVELNNTMITPYRLVDDTPKGYIIELFILDPIPRDNDEKNLWIKKQWIYTELMNTTFSTLIYRKIDCIDEDLFDLYLNKVKDLGKEKIILELEEELFTIEEEDCDEYMLRWYSDSLFFKKEWLLGEPRVACFEDTFLPILPMAERAFEEEYGYNWMYYPESIDSNHSFVKNEDIPYSTYVNDYMQFIDKDEINNLYEIKKVVSLRRQGARISTLRISQQMHELLLKTKLNKLLNKYNVSDLNGIETSINEYRLFFHSWKTTQYSKVFKLTRKYLDIGDENLYVLLHTLMDEGDYTDALVVLNWKKKNLKNTKKLEDLYSLLFHTSNAYTEFYSNNLKNAFEHLKLSEKILPDIRLYDREYLRFLYRINYTTDDKQLLIIKNDLIAFKNEYINKPEILYLQGQVEIRLGNTKSAVNLYKECKEKTKNGMIILEINDYLSNV